jgi:hypothetical protein
MAKGIREIRPAPLRPRLWRQVIGQGEPSPKKLFSKLPFYFPRLPSARWFWLAHSPLDWTSSLAGGQMFQCSPEPSMQWFGEEHEHKAYSLPLTNQPRTRLARTQGFGRIVSRSFERPSLAIACPSLAKVQVSRAGRSRKGTFGRTPSIAVHVPYLALRHCKARMRESLSSSRLREPVSRR